MTTRESRIDNWQNALTGVGTALRDKLTSTTFLTGTILDDVTAESVLQDLEAVEASARTDPWRYAR